MRRTTLVVAAGRPPAGPGAPVNVPVTFSSTYRWGGDVAYGRDGNSAWEAFEAVVGELEGGEAIAFASGMAAIAAVVESLPVGAIVVVPDDSYNGTRHLLDDLAARGRIVSRLIDVTDTGSTLAACAGASLLWLESPTNPLLAIADLRSLCRGAREAGVPVVVDNTFATPLVQRPLELGADLVVHSATKFLSGHSDVLGGVVVAGDPGWVDALRLRRSLHGAVLGPMEAFLLLRGVRTLGVRLDRAQENAAELAQRLASHPAVNRVRYPGLADHPGHQLAASQMDGFGAMLAFEVAPLVPSSASSGLSPSARAASPGSSGLSPSARAAEAVCAAVRLCTDATSLGGVETLIERRRRWGWENRTPDGLLRMSVGIEDVEDIWEDLSAALAQLG